MKQVDVEIIGGGIFGLAIAWSCIRMGSSVRVIERRRIGVGASGGPVGALAPHAPDNWNAKKGFQLESLLLADTWWAGVAAASGIDPGYARTGRLQPLPAREGANELAAKRVKAASVNWKGKAEWMVVEPEGSWHPRTASGLLVHDTLSARINPADAIRSLVEALRARGCEICEGRSPELNSRFKVLATGHEGLLELNREIGREIGRGEKGQALLLDHDARTLPQIYCDGIHVVPHANGTTAVGSTSERYFDDPSSIDERLDELHARAVDTLPVIRGAKILYKWAGVRPRTATRAPIVGAHPYKKGCYIANGGFKIGFGLAPKIGDLLAELIHNGNADIPDEFSPARLLARSS